MRQRRTGSRRLAVLGCWMGVLFAGVLPGWAQHRDRDAALSESSYTFDLRGASLDEALQEVIAETRIDVAYASALVAGKKTTCGVIEAEVEAVLRCVLDGQGLVVQRLASGAYVVKRRMALDSTGAGSRPGLSSGAITGVVVERATNRPLAGANVVVVGTQAGAASGPDGRFTILLPASDYALEASMIGYETTRIEPVRVRHDAATALTLALAEALTPLREVVVMPGYFSLLHRQPASRQVLTRDEIVRLPTLGDDVYRAIRRLPGVSGNDFSAKFTVRGGAYEEVLVRLDGMELYEPFHLKDAAGGVFSIIDAEAIGGVEMMTGAFPVDYGNRLSGVFDIESASPPERRRTSLGLSLSNARFLSEGRFDAGKGQWLAVARRGYIDLLLRLIGESETFEPRYYDLYAKVQYQVHPKHTLSAHVLSADDQTRFVDGADFSLHSAYGNTYGWVAWSATVTPRLLTQTTLSLGRITRNRTGVDFFDDSDGEMVFRVGDRRSFNLYGLRQDWTYEHADRYLLKAGFDVKRLDAAYAYENQVRTVEIPTADFDTTRAALQPSGAALGAYLGARIRLLPALTVETGARYDYASWPHDRHVSPRLNLAYALGARTAVRLGWGWFYQSQGIHEMDVQDGDDAFHPAQRAQHRTLGLEHVFANGIQLRLEAYQKRLSNLRPTYLNLPHDVLYSFPEAEPGRVRFVPEQGEARGLEFFVKNDAREKLTWWAGYTLAFAEDTIEGVAVPRHFDQRHTIQVDLGYRSGRRWDLHVAWLFHSGWPYTPSTVEQVATPDGDYFHVVPGPVNAARLPSYHRLDLRVSRHFTFSNSRLSVFLDVQNLYNRKNVRQYIPSNAYLDPNGEVAARTTSDYFLPLLPSFGVRWDLFHGSR